MLKRVRIFLSVNLITGLLLSTFVLSNSIPVKACPPPPPKNLLSLYLHSDLIFVATITNEKDGKLLPSEMEDYSNLEIIRNLKISSVLKGKTARNFLYKNTEYKSKNPVEVESDEGSIRELPYFFSYGYKGQSKLAVGERYLFFFTKDEETNEYSLTDYTSGYRKLSDADLSVFEDRIKELNSIVGKKENQLAEITEWLIRCVEKPATRWDGAFVLGQSFDYLGYEDEDDEREPFVLDKTFYSGNAWIAAIMSDSQKEFISGMLFSSINDEISEASSAGLYYGLSNLVSNWDKMRLATYAFSFLQSADKSDTERTQEIMYYISSILKDDKLREIYYRYPSDLSDESEKTDVQEITTDDEIADKIETAENISEDSEQNTDSKVEEVKETENRNITFEEMQKRNLQKFVERYEHLLVRNFAPDSEN